VTQALDPEPLVDLLAAADSAGTSEGAELRLNGQSEARPASCSSMAGARWLERQDFVRLRLRPPPVTPRIVGGREYLPLAAVPGVHVSSVDVAASAADLTLPSSAFVATTQSLQARAAPRVAQGARGAFLNYEVYAQHGDYAGGNTSGGFGELGVFTGAGVLTKHRRGQRQRRCAAARCGSRARSRGIFLPHCARCASVMRSVRPVPGRARCVSAESSGQQFRHPARPGDHAADECRRRRAGALVG
jgi:hypothetical protein